MSERRREERKRLITFAPVYDLQKDFLLGYLGDLNLLGAMLLGKKSMDVDHHLTLAIKFPETPETPATRSTIPARVAWCRQEEDTAYFNIGFQFLELSEENRKVIEAILNRYQFRPESPDWQATNRAAG